MADEKTPEEIKKGTEATEENTEARNENTEAIKDQTEAVKGQAEATAELNVQAGVAQNRAEELIGTLKSQFSQYVNLSDATGKYAAAQNDVLSLQKELAQADVENNPVKYDIV